MAWVVLLPAPLFSQFTAGSIPATHTLTTYSIHLEPLTDFSFEEASIDVDCDGSMDLKFHLERNIPDIDYPNRLNVRRVDDSIRVCAADTSSFCNFMIAFAYVQGQLLNCSTPFSMVTDTNIVVGDYVTITCGGDALQDADSAYIHYEKSVNGSIHEGWILLSFDLMSGFGSPLNPWADIIASTGVCSEIGIIEGPARPKFNVFPNPSSSNQIHWTGDGGLHAVLVYDGYGRLMHTAAGGIQGVLDLGNRTGVHFILGISATGVRSQIERLVLVY